MRSVPSAQHKRFASRQASQIQQQWRGGGRGVGPNFSPFPDFPGFSALHPVGAPPCASDAQSPRGAGAISFRPDKSDTNLPTPASGVGYGSGGEASAAARVERTSAAAFPRKERISMKKLLLGVA